MKREQAVGGRGSGQPDLEEGSPSHFHSSRAANNNSFTSEIKRRNIISCACLPLIAIPLPAGAMDIKIREDSKTLQSRPGTEGAPGSPPPRFPFWVADTMRCLLGAHGVPTLVYGPRCLLKELSCPFSRSWSSSLLVVALAMPSLSCSFSSSSLRCCCRKCSRLSIPWETFAGPSRRTDPRPGIAPSHIWPARNGAASTARHMVKSA